MDINTIKSFIIDTDLDVVSVAWSVGGIWLLSRVVKQIFKALAAESFAYELFHIAGAPHNSSYCKNRMRQVVRDFSEYITDGKNHKEYTVAKRAFYRQLNPTDGSSPDDSMYIKDLA